MAYLPPRPATASTTAYTAVSSATRRLNDFSACSCSSCTSCGGVISAKGRCLLHLFAHGLAARLEGAHQALRLLLEELTALVEPFAGAALRVHRQLLCTPHELAALFLEKATVFLAGARGEQQRCKPTQGRAEEKPPEIRAAAPAPVSGHGSSLRSVTYPRT